jgi:hypothetical protein
MILGYSGRPIPRARPIGFTIVAAAAETRPRVRLPVPAGAVGRSYQLAFFTPGISPRLARLRKQIRQMPNFR